MSFLLLSHLILTWILWIDYLVDTYGPWILDRKHRLGEVCCTFKGAAPSSEAEWIQITYSMVLFLFLQIHYEKCKAFSLSLSVSVSHSLLILFVLSLCCVSLLCLSLLCLCVSLLTLSAMYFCEGVSARVYMRLCVCVSAHSQSRKLSLYLCLSVSLTLCWFFLCCVGTKLVQTFYKRKSSKSENSS